ncbi:MAG: hypothetical protein Q4G43_11655 [Mobilicoccus sp.]|nr:hypothetical protein [Mobilicoccus sp.]
MSNAVLSARGLDSAWNLWRFGLLLVLVGLVAAAVVTGARSTSLEQLRDRIAEGQVDSAHLIGALSPEAIGNSHVEILWNDGAARRTQVEQIREDPDTTVSRSGDGPPVISGDVAAHLRGFAPGGTLTVTEEPHRTGFSSVVYGWRVPAWVMWAVVAWTVAVIGTIIAGPSPRHATRWAWVWLALLIGPLGQVAYLLAGLSRRGAQETSESGVAERPRLTGGWGFLIGLVLGAIITATSS